MSLSSVLRRISNHPIAGRIIWSPLKLVPKGAALPIVTGPLRGRKWVLSSTFRSAWLGLMEYDKQLLFRRLAKPGAVVYDVGANVGFYTLLASVLVGPQGKVFAFEPLPRTIDILRRHVRINDLANVTIFAGAVSDHEGTARFDAGAIPEMGHLSDKGEFEVQLFQLDALLAAGRIAPPALMKIDVEGAEVDVLTGAKHILDTHRPHILLATHGIDTYHRACDLLRAHRYDVETLDDPHKSTHELRLGEVLATPQA